ncbi:excinuclease ABC subunit UvrC [Candidatus Daviesbacteria bacterium]|nr:excinuclease ABC subunit UvrC [Candidatus Daviesbacteria bacterium]
MIPSFLNKEKLPKKSGVYIFKSSQEDILYVGKAINLYHRVSSYFNRNVDGRTAALVSNISSVETYITESELEALILEANLIKKHLPPFNIRLTDDKDFLYIGISNEQFPKVVTIRKKDLKTVKKFFGPFPSSRTVRNTLKQLRRVFPWCSNPPKFTLQPSRLQAPVSYGTGQAKHRACFYYHLGLCPGLCTGMINKEEYSKIIKRFSKFLEGKKEELVSGLSKEMMELSKTQQFEKAAQVKKMLDGISYLTQTNRAQAYLENPNFLEEENKLALKQLQKDLNLDKLPGRIEGYDISNIGGKDAVGSMVVIIAGEIDKSQYRKFKIRISGRPDDVGMHREMIKRRLKHTEWQFPDLIIVDGGRGQARVVNFQFSIFNFQIPVFGLAKKREWLYPAEGKIIKLPKSSLSLRLLQKLRDESHRFAISYHRKLRDRILG